MRDMQTTTPLKDKQDSRRRIVAEAALRVIARDGMEGASMRAIAHEIGQSTGVLTHYFRDKESLVLFTVSAVAESVTETLTPLFETTLTPRSFTDAFEQMVDSDEITDVYWRAWLALTTASMRGGAVQAQQSRSYENYRRAIATLLVKLKNDGWLNDDLDVKEWAMKLVAFIDGIGIQSIISPETLGPSTRASAVRSYCDDMFTRYRGSSKLDVG
jgi:AcrR family transcriptional regulator